MIGIVIADDHPIFRQGLRQIIETDSALEVVAEAEDGQTALERIEQSKPEIAILDVDMPRSDGFEVARALQEKRISTKIIFLTMHKDERFLKAALNAGVQGYALKESGDYNTYGNLIFFAAFGDTSYQPNKSNRAVWAFLAKNLIGQLGGTQQVFYLVNNKEHSPAPQPQPDDYTLVGGFVDSQQTGLQGQKYAEMSSVIARETEAYPLSSEMEGFLKVDHQGYYSPGSTTHRFGIATPDVADAINASSMNSVPWPFPGPNQAKSQAAYTWISQQLCCNDIRSAYIKPKCITADLVRPDLRTFVQFKRPPQLGSE